MNGIELSRLFNEEYVEPMLCEKFSDVRGLIATGLAGQGSECYGFDDELSRDHDFGAGVCLWIPRRVEDKIGNALREAYALLPDIGCSKTVTERGSRIGVHTIESFYESLIGRPDAPADSMEWLRIPDKFYSQATNGEVFSDPLGEFTAVRDTLLAYYPDDVLKKKLAANCAGMAQAGQYNYARSLARKDFGAAYLACAEFVRHALAALYLLNGRYMPFYKWAFRGTHSFEILGGCAGRLRMLVSSSDLLQGGQKQEQIEEICRSVGQELINRGLSDSGDDFMQYHANKITASIEDDKIRSLPIMFGGV